MPFVQYTFLIAKNFSITRKLKTNLKPSLNTTYLSIGIDTRDSTLGGGAELPVSGIRPGQTKIIEFDCYKSLVPPQANFSGMNGKTDLYITAALYKAFVDVNEEGTEAAAATGVVVGVTSLPADPKVFRADHPFLLMIRDNRTGSILFMGRVVSPGEL